MKALIDCESKKAYKEVNDILDIMGNEYKKEIPTSILNALKLHEDKYYKSEIKQGISFMEQKISREALAILSMLNLMYWIKDDEEKERLKKIYSKNDLEYEEKLRKKYDVNKIFESNKNKKIDNVNKVENIENSSLKNEDKQLAIVRNGIFSKIKKFIFKIFNIK